MGSVKHINADANFAPELANAGSKLVIVDFFATWCGPCVRIAPVFDQLSRRYLKAVFLKVDVDKCKETAAIQGVSAMPTFLFYRNRTKIDRMQGADANLLEQKIKQHYGNEDDDENSSPGGHMDLSTLISKSGSECLNESDDHPFIDCLASTDSSYLESDCDEQLIMSITFNQAIKAHSLKFKTVGDNGPKTVKLFINQPHTIDFDSADSLQPIQVLDISPKDLLDGSPIPLRYVKFQNVSNLQLFVKDNQADSDKTKITHFAVIGTPLSTMNMNDFKRVAGKKGEGH